MEPLRNVVACDEQVLILLVDPAQHWLYDHSPGSISGKLVPARQGPADGGSSPDPAAEELAASLGAAYQSHGDHYAARLTHCLLSRLLAAGIVLTALADLQGCSQQASRGDLPSKTTDS